MDGIPGGWVPLRKSAEHLPIEVSWDEAKREVVVFSHALPWGNPNLRTFRYKADDMLTDHANDYPYQTITDGTIVLRKTEPAPPQISDDEAVAIITDGLTSSEALDIITGGAT